MASKKGRFVISNLQDSEKLDIMTEVHTNTEEYRVKDESNIEPSIRVAQSYDRQNSLLDASPPYSTRPLKQSASPMNKKLIDKEVSTDVDYFDTASNRRSHDIRSPSEISRHHDCESVPIPVMLMFQDTLSTKVIIT